MLPVSRDRLTQLYTEEYLEEGFDAELTRARRYKHPLSLILLEPDIPEEFKADRLYASLKILARLAESQTRVMDIGIRWGQQILLVLPETPRDGAVRVVEKIRGAYENHALLKNDPDIKFPIRLRASVKAFPDHGQEKEQLLALLRDTMTIEVEGPANSAATALTSDAQAAGDAAAKPAADSSKNASEAATSS
ncbi:MAG: diguanylate cyclase [Candidatus Xenobia bacterium]